MAATDAMKYKVNNTKGSKAESQSSDGIPINLAGPGAVGSLLIK